MGHVFEQPLRTGAWNPYFHNPKLERRLNRVTAPPLVVWGRKDRLIPFAHGKRYAARIPDARLAIVENCGHLPALEQPDALFDLITGFARPSTGTQTRPATHASV